MTDILVFLIGISCGIVAGAAAAALFVWNRFTAATDREKLAESKLESANQLLSEAGDKRRELESEFQKLARQEESQNAAREQVLRELEAQRAKLDEAERAFNRRAVSYQELQKENTLLKRDLHNAAVSMNKLDLDQQNVNSRQQQIDEKSNELGQRYLTETVKSVVERVGPNNFTACKQRLLTVIQWVRDIGYLVPKDREENLLIQLRGEFERAVRLAFEKEEQSRIKSQIQEEERLKREIEKELKQIERERAAIQAALDRALAEATDKHNDEIVRLQARLADAEERARRTQSMAELTKAGHVYIISNIGSFGENVFKIGMTRRWEPMERIDELSSASVPFPFDVHMMIKCDNAPALENALHRALHKLKINKVRPRKEFFKVDIHEIEKIVRENHGEVQYVADPEALEYRQCLTMSDEDAAYIEQVYESAEDKVPDSPFET